MQSDRWKQIQGLFEAAQQHPADERHAFLRDACPDDPELCSEVVKLLRAADSDDSFLDAPIFPSATEQPLLKNGEKVGVFEIQELIGRGGMGEVYRARDLRLMRDVAMKVVLEVRTTDAERLRRFEQEARTVSLLNHPNILAIYDIGTHNGVPYIVSELLEGQTLRSCLARGQIPFSNALDYAQQLADGLAAAHQKGIVHRDLKPENLFVTNDGRLKILDFGLAKLGQPKFAGPGEATSLLPESTEPGMILGTVGYMSPEQVQGRPADARSDIFVMGLILHEMLTGQMAFHGSSAAETMSAILRDDPPQVSDLNPKLPKGISLVVRHCLEKRQEDRFESARDLAFALRTSTRSATPTAPRWRPGARLLVVAAIAVLVAAPMAFNYWYWRQRPRPLDVVSLEIDPPAGRYVQDGSVSPDGTQVALLLSAPDVTGSQVWIRPFTGFSWRALSGTEGASSFRWSPDSREIAFTQDNQIRILDLGRGSAQTVCEAKRATLWDWGGNGMLLFGMNAADQTQLHQVPAAGGLPQLIVPLDQSRKEMTQTRAQFLPDGNRILYHSVSELNSGDYVASIGGSARTMVSSDVRGRFVRFVRHPRTGRYYFLTCDSSACKAQEFEPSAVRLLGSPIAVVSPPALIGVSAVASALVFLTPGEPPRSRLAWFSRAGRELATVVEADTIYSHELAADDRQVTWERLRPPQFSGDIWVKDLARGSQLRMTGDDGWEYEQRFWPDGKRIAYMWFRDHPRRFQISLKPVDGSGPEESLYVTPNYIELNDITPDGTFILYRLRGAPTTLWILPLIGRRPVLYLSSENDSLGSRFSPDGRWIAYTSSDSASSEVHVRDFDPDAAAIGYSHGVLTVVSTGGGELPRWSHDGTELFYKARDNWLMAVKVSTAGRFSSGRPERLFRLPSPNVAKYRVPFAVSRDANRFLIAVQESEDTGRHVTVVMNWMDSLAQR